MKTHTRALFLYASVAALTAASAAQAQERTFDLAAQDARQSIPEFAREAGLQIAAPTAQLQGLRTHAVKGSLDERAALKLLLKGTGLSVVSDDGDMIVLRKAPERMARLIPASSRSVDVAAVSPPEPQAAQPASPPHLEEVVVTAQRRNEKLQNVPVAVVAVRAEELEAKGVTSTGDLSSLTPGLVSNTADGFAMPHIRGIGTSDDTAGVSSPIAIYVDGVYIDSAAGSLLTMNNIQQIEVDKGPQGTLFGRNATGGVIQITTLQPSQTFGGKISQSIDNYATTVTDLYVTGGITKDLAADLSLRYSDQLNGWGHNLYNGQSIGKGWEFDVRSKWAWTPTDRDKITFSIDHESMNDSFDTLDYVNGTKPYDLGLSPIQIKTGSPWDVTEFKPSQHLLNETGVSATVRHEFDFATLTSISAWRSADTLAYTTQSLPPFDIEAALGGKYRQFTQEVQLASPVDSRIKWVVGAFYMHSSSQDAPYVISQHGTPAIPGGAFGFPPLPPGVMPVFGPDAFGTVTTSTQTTNSGAIYGQVTAPVTDRTNLTVGLRYTAEAASIFGAGTFIPPGAKGSAYFAVPTWRLAVDHHFADNLMAFASYSRGFKAGTFGDNAPQNPATKPETLDAYEVGLKSEYLDHRLRINASGFYYDYTNIVEPLAIAGTGGVVVIPTNGPKAEVYGLDFDAEARVSDHLRVSFSLEALHSQFTNYPGATFFLPAATGGGVTSYFASAAGNQLPVAPELTSDLTVTYKVSDFTMTASWDHNSGWFDGPDNGLRQNPFEMVSSEISWAPAGTNLRVSVWGRNLANAVVFARTITVAPFGYIAAYQAPRTFGLRAEYKF